MPEYIWPLGVRHTEIEVRELIDRPTDGWQDLPVLLTVPRWWMKDAQALQKAVGVSKLHVIQLGGSVMGRRFKRIIVLAEGPWEDLPRQRYEVWREENMRTKLANGCLENLHEVPV